METWMVTLAAPDGKDQRVLVSAPAGDTEDDVREYVLRPDITGTKGERITLESPTVIGMRKLAVRRPHITVLPEVHKTTV